MRRAVLGCSLLVVAACASEGAHDRPQGPPPPLSVFGAPGKEFRFRRILQSTARNEAWLTQRGFEHRFPGMEIRMEIEQAVRTEDVDASGRRFTELLIRDFAASMRGLNGESALDSKRPETMRAAEM